MMGAFVACGVLVTLGWGGVTSVLVSVSEASSERGPVQCGDA